MPFRLLFTDEANENLGDLETDPSQKAQHNAVLKTLGFLETNRRHPSLQTKKYHAITGPADEPVFESYAQNRTPGAIRVFWFYGPGKGVITVSSIVSHP